MAISWTDAQKDAIQTRDKTLLVAAAAGSGKTATLTERVIRAIIVDRTPINKMLIVTFTRAATAELKNKVSIALKTAILNNPKDEKLEKQLQLLPSAHISTIDAFCSDILRENAEHAGVNPLYRIADEAEAALVAEGLLNGLIEELYEGRLPEIATPEEITALAECLTDARRHGELAALIRSVYDDTKDLLDGVSRIRRLVEEYNPEKFTTVEATTYGAHAMALVYEYAEHFRHVSELHIEANIENGTEEAKSSARIKILQDDIAFFDKLLSAPTYEAMREYILGASFEKNSKIPMPKTYEGVLPNTKDMRNEYIRKCADFSKEIFTFSTDEWRSAYTGLYEILSVFVRIVEEFDTLFMREKDRLGIMEFSDVSRYTYKCLWEGDARTDIAIRESEKYDAIYVDEYQDVNRIQHKIFEAISRENNRFMVGDIKQAIYGFRGADSSIFRGLKEEYPKLDDGSGDKATIFMSENFRCDEGVIDFTNRIFDRLFYVMRESLSYVSDDRLVFSKKYEDEECIYREPELCLIPSPTKKGVFAEDEETVRIEAEVIAEKIDELLKHGKKNNGKDIQPGDIAIIMRSLTSRLKPYVDALEARGIPVAYSDATSFFLNPEIMLMMSILNSIDNPHKSIYLAGAMMSPVFRFRTDEVSAISKMRGATLYASLLKYMEEHPDYRRGREFLDWLDRYRTLAEGVSVDRLIARIYRETNILAVADGEGGRETLNRLYEHSRRFESSAFKGLYNFINYIDSVIERKNSFNQREANLDPRAVKIITSHASKGLEFPVVFFSYLSYGFNKNDSDKLMFDPEFGIMTKLMSRSGATRLVNPMISIIDSMIYRRRIEEEARILYVSLTRARERLYLVGTPRKNVDKVIAEIEDAKEVFDSYAAYNIANFIEMVTHPAGIMPTDLFKFVENMPDRLKAAFMEMDEETADAKGTKAAEDIAPEGANESGADIASEPPKGANENGADIASEPPKGLQDTTRAPSYVEDGDAEMVLPDNVDSVTFEEIDGPPAALQSSPEDILLERFRYKYPDDYLTRMPEKLSVSRLAPDVLDMDASEMTVEEITEKRSHYNMERLPSFRVGASLTESAKRGISTHLLFQFCDFEALRDKGAEHELLRLVKENYLSPDDKERVRIREVEMFRRSELLRDILSAKKVYRELRFNVRLPAVMFTEREHTREATAESGYEILVQGVIDCLYEDGEGNLHLVDYKTDRLTAEEREDPALAAKKLYDSHARQLYYYTEAVKRMLQREPKTVEVYSLQLGRCVDVKIIANNE